MSLEWVYKIGGSGTGLTQNEVDNNILCCYGALSKYGWTKEAIAGACGCFYEESGLNPGIYETSHGGTLDNLPYFPGGMGLAQWTDYPAYKATYPNPLAWSAQRESQNWYNGNFQCWLLTKCADPNYTSMGYGQGPRWGWQKSSSYPSIDFSDYVNFSGDVGNAVKYWFYCFEWHDSYVPPEVSISARVNWGNYAYDLISGKTPEAPGGGGEGGGGEISDAYYLYALIAHRKRRLKVNG